LGGPESRPGRGGEEKYRQVKGRNDLGDLSIDMRIALEWIVKKRYTRACTGFKRLGIGSSDEFVTEPTEESPNQLGDHHSSRTLLHGGSVSDLLISACTPNAFYFTDVPHTW
jgi:hypothetical protein